MFFVVLIQFVDNAISSQLHPTFFVGWYHTPYLSTDARFFLIPAILVAQVLVEAMGNTPPIWLHGVGDIWVVILSCWILYICVWVPEICTSMQRLHSFFVSLSDRVEEFNHVRERGE